MTARRRLVQNGLPPLVAGFALLLAAACGSSPDAPRVTVRWDRSSLALPAADGCACAYVEYLRDGAVDGAVGLSLTMLGDPAGAPTVNEGLTPGTSPCAQPGPLTAGQFHGWAHVCGGGVAGTWRVRASAFELPPPGSTGAPGPVLATADVDVVVP